MSELATLAAPAKQARVKVTRFRDGYSLVGPPVVIFPLEETAKLLRRSGFMDEWIERKISEALAAGHEFVRRSPETGGVASVYKMATDDDVLFLADAGMLTDRPARRRSSTEQAFILRFQTTDDLKAKFANLPRQAQVVLSLLKAAGRDRFSMGAIEVIMTENVESLKTRQDPVRIFAFYKNRFLSEGHLEED